MLTSLERVFIERDGFSLDEAQEEINRLHRLILDLIEEGVSTEEIFEVWLNETGLEPDYLDELLFLKGRE